MVCHTDWLYVAETALVLLGTLEFITFIYLLFIGKVG
jgi:hypothetical protein